MKSALKLLTIFFILATLASCQKEFSNTDTQQLIDVDAQRFIDSAGISDELQKTAVNYFVVQLKDSSLWPKFLAIYPMVGGSDSNCKWNLMDPRNLDTAFRLTFSGSPIFASTGVLFPTTSDFADTHLSDTKLASNNGATISYYSITQNTIDGYDMGCADHALPYNEFAIYNSSDASNWFGYYQYGAVPVNTRGLFMVSATATDVKRYENGIMTNSKGSAPIMGSTGLSILIGSVLGADTGGQRECALATIGFGLTDSEASMFYTIVKNFETALGR